MFIHAVETVRICQIVTVNILNENIFVPKAFKITLNKTPLQTEIKLNEILKLNTIALNQILFCV